MKKILMFSIILGLMLMSVNFAVAGNQQSEAVNGNTYGYSGPWGPEGHWGVDAPWNNQYGFTKNNPENAMEVSPGVFYLGSKVEKGQVLENYAFVHYAKDSDSANSKPVWDDSVDIYKFMFGGIKWADTMTYEVNTAGSELDDIDVMDTLEASLETWDTETSFELFDTLDTTTESYKSGDGINRVTFDDLSLIYGANVIAVNSFWFSTATKVIVESDVVFNSYYTWNVDVACPEDKMDLQSIATHEFGHNGLNDLYMPKASELTMYGYGSFGETKTRILGTGDISGIQALYGA